MQPVISFILFYLSCFLCLLRPPIRKTQVSLTTKNRLHLILFVTNVKCVCVRVCVCGVWLSAILWNAASPGSFESTFGSKSKAFDLFRCLLTRKRTLAFPLSWDERTRGNVGPSPSSYQI